MKSDLLFSRLIMFNFKGNEIFLFTVNLKHTFESLFAKLIEQVDSHSEDHDVRNKVDFQQQ